MFDTFSGSFPVNAFFLLLCDVPSSAGPNCNIQYNVKFNFHMLHVIFRESDLWYGVTNQHRLSMNSVRLTHERD